MEYIDNNAQDIVECRDSDYNMRERCFIQLFSYGKREDDDRVADRTDSSEAYNLLVWRVWSREHTDLSYLAPHEWPSLPFLSEEDQQMLLGLHPSAPPLKFISDYDVKLVQRLLYFTKVDLW